MRGGIMGWLLLRRFVKDECAKTKGMLSAYIDQRLSPKVLREVEHHLEACQRCQEELDSLRATVGLLHRVPQVLPSRSFAIAEVKPVPRRTAVWALRAATSVAAVFLMLVFAGDLVNLFEVTPSLVDERGAPASTLGPEGGEEQETAPSPGEKWCFGPEAGLFNSLVVEGWITAGVPEFGPPSEEEGPAEEEEPSPPSEEEELAREEAGWLRPLEYGFLGVVAVLGGMTIANWRKEKKM
jgi:hypothetical protein